MLHHGNGLVGVEVGFAVQARQAEQRLLCLLHPALPNQPPRRLRSEVNADDERYWPHPLQGVRNSVSPFALAARQHGSNDTNTNQLTHSPACVDVRGEVAAQRDWADFRGVADGQGLEDTPRDTCYNVGYEQVDYALSHEEEGGDTDDDGETGDEDFAVSEPFGCPTVDEETDDLTDWKTRLLAPIFGEAAVQRVDLPITPLLSPACQAGVSSYEPSPRPVGSPNFL